MPVEPYLPELIGVVALGGLVVLRLAFLYARGNAKLDGTPMEKRTHLFETADGNRYNPVSDWTPRTDPNECPKCGHMNDESFHYCSECAEQLPVWD